MKKKRMVFTIGWYFLTISILGMALAIAGVALFLYLYFAKMETICLVIFVIGSVFLILYFIVFGICFWQWVVIDENKIIAKHLFGVIREISWDDVEEVRGAAMRFHLSYPVALYFVFIDNKFGKLDFNRPGNRKGYCIKILASKRARAFLLQCKPDLIFTIQYDEEG